MDVSHHDNSLIFVNAYGFGKLIKFAEVRVDGTRTLFYSQRALTMYSSWGATFKITELSERLEGIR